MHVHSCIHPRPAVFPLEIFDLIIDESDYEDLFILSLIGPSWKERAQRWLFQQVDLVAGPRCVRWRSRKYPDGFKTYPTLLPDTFKALYITFSSLDPALLKRIKTITFRGLNRGEHGSALVQGFGAGNNPHIDLCVLSQFLRILPNVRTIRLRSVLWSTCLASLISFDHCCFSTSDIRTFNLIHLHDVSHGRPEDNVFDVMELSSRCNTLAIDSIQWRHFTTPYQSYTRRRKQPDIQRVTMNIPTSLIHHEMTRRYPTFGNLVAVDIKIVNAATRVGLTELLKANSHSLESLAFHIRDEGKLSVSPIIREYLC